MNISISILIKQITFNVPKEFSYFYILLECMIGFIGIFFPDISR